MQDHPMTSSTPNCVAALNAACRCSRTSSVVEQGTTPEGIAPIGLPSPPGRPALLANEGFLRSPSFLGKADPRSLVGSASLMKVRDALCCFRMPIDKTFTR